MIEPDGPGPVLAQHSQFQNLVWSEKLKGKNYVHFKSHFSEGKAAIKNCQNKADLGSF